MIQPIKTLLIELFSKKAFKNPQKICPYCGDVVTELKEHMIRKGHVVASELHKCPHCDYTHHKQTNIKQHINRQSARKDYLEWTGWWEMDPLTTNQNSQLGTIKLGVNDKRATKSTFPSMIERDEI